MSLGVIEKVDLARMPRWEPDSRARLQESALALYDRKGFDATTVEEIAERAGLTKRTFFRHFADKREVLFGGGEQIEALVADAVRSAPKSAHALDAVSAGLDSLCAMLEHQGETAARRIRIVRASPELWERQLIKFASLAGVISDALRTRGVGDTDAILAAESGVTALRVASDRWIRNVGRKSLRRYLGEALDELRKVTSR